MIVLFIYTCAYFISRSHKYSNYEASLEMHIMPFMWFVAAFVAHALGW
jgi:hypothetical protein